MTAVEWNRLFDQLQESVAVYDVEGRIVYVNPAVERLLRRSSHELVGRLLSEVLPGPVGDQLQRSLEQAVASPEPHRFDLRDPDSGRTWACTTYRVADRVCCLARDVTRDKATETRLSVLAEASRAFSSGGLEPGRICEDVARILADALGDSCVIRLLSLDGPFLDPPIGAADRDTRRVAGLRALPRQPAGEGFPGEALRARRSFLVPEPSSVIAPLLAGDQTLGVIILARHPSGTRAPYSERDLLIVEDIAGRTALAVANARSFEEARESDRRKDEFLAMLGHELRNPLAPILTATQLMRMRGAADKFTRELDVIDRQVRRVVSLVEDLLDVSRITRGKIELKRERFELSRVVAEAIEMASPLVEQRGHDLTVAVPSGLLVDGDPGRLAQVVANLITNAAKYTEKGGKIAIEAGGATGDVELRVRDTGRGIAADLLPRIFDLFVQGPRSLERGEGGLGLGLPIVKSLVSLHGGSVDVSSVVGRGSEFIVRLPAASRSTSPIVDTVGPHAVAPVGRRVLVVDDNTDAAEVVAEGLRTCGHLVAVAHDAPAALAVAEGFCPEVAVLDIGLPVIDGWELGQRLRDLPGLGGVRLIALTGYGQDSDRRQSAAAGFAHHFTKPVTLERLLAAITDPPPA